MTDLKFKKVRNNLSSLKSLSAVTLLCASFGATTVLQAADDKSASSKAWGSEKVAPNKVNVDLRGLSSSPTWQPGDSIKDMPRRRFDANYVLPSAPRNPVAKGNDRLMAAQNSFSVRSNENTRAIEQQFDGSGYTGVNPPDTSGDVGLNYYIQSINGSSGSIFTIYDKETGNLVSGPTNMETLGSGNCATGAGDPIILFDEMANRWLLSEFSSFGNNLCVYISQTSDPITGGWFAYSFTAPSFPDYPKYGVGQDAYYVGTNENTSAVYALDRDAMLAGNAATMIRIETPDLAGFGFQMIPPVDHDGVNDMPAGTPGYFVRHRDDEVHNSASNNPNEDYIELWEFVADFANTNNSTFTKVADFPIAEFDSDLCGLTSFSCFPQAGSSSTLDPLREVVMFRAQYRNFNTHETIVGNFVTDVDGTDHGGIRWFELRKTGAGAWALEQEGTYSPDGKNRWMGSIAMDKDGNMALAYSWASSTDFPGIRYTGRLASDANGVMTEAEAILVAGTDGNSSNRWGDYSHLSLDPVDECTFWYTNQYGKENGQWGTHISSFKFDSCGGGTGGNQNPVASFTSSCTLLDCTFDGAGSSDSDGSVASYSWDFGDGSTATGSNPAYTYAADGTYSVALTVTDDQGATNTNTQSVTVSTGNQAPVSGFTFVATELSVAFTDTSTDSDGTVDVWSWDFGDGSTSSAQNPTNNYASAGTYTVSLTVTDDAGTTNTSNQTVTVSLDNIPPISNFTYTLNELEVTFADSSSDSDGTVSSWSWDFGDGASSASQNPVHVYSLSGTYTVALTVTDDQGTTNTSSQAVTVESAGGGTTGGFTDANVSPGSRENLEFTIDVPAGATALDIDTSGGTGDVTLVVNFGSTPSRNDNDCIEQGAGNAHSCSFTDPSEGTWFIIVRGVSASSGVQLDAYWTAGEVGNVAPTSDFSVTTIDLEATFTDSSTDSDGTVASYSWDFGDGNISTAQNPINTYTAAGTYTVSLTVTDDEGATGTSSQSVTVTDAGTVTSGGFTETVSPNGGQILSYTLDVPAGATSLEVDIAGGTGNADLAINFGSSPTRNDNDCLETGAGNTHNCTITNPSEGTWFIIVRGASASTDVQLDAYWYQN